VSDVQAVTSPNLRRLVAAYRTCLRLLADPTLSGGELCQADLRRSRLYSMLADEAARTVGIADYPTLMAGAGSKVGMGRLAWADATLDGWLNG
jgi:hypothetical protein